MSATAQLMGVVAHGNHADLITVLLAKQGHGPHGAGLGLRHEMCLNYEVINQHFIHALFDLCHHLRRDRSRTGKVKAKSARGVLGTHLGGRVAQAFPECPMNEVGSRMRPRDGLASGNINLGNQRGPRHQLTRLDDAAVQKETRDRCLHVIDIDNGAIARDKPAMVTQLTAGLGIERRAVKDNLDMLTC